MKSSLIVSVIMLLLCLFDGTPAGFKICDVVYNGDSATFKIEFEKMDFEYLAESARNQLNK